MKALIFDLFPKIGSYFGVDEPASSGIIWTAVPRWGSRLSLLTTWLAEGGRDGVLRAQNSLEVKLLLFTCDPFPFFAAWTLFLSISVSVK